MLQNNFREIVSLFSATLRWSDRSPLKSRNKPYEITEKIDFDACYESWEWATMPHASWHVYVIRWRHVTSHSSQSSRLSFLTAVRAI